MSEAKGVLTFEEVKMLRQEYLNNSSPVQIYNNYFLNKLSSF